MKKLMVMAAAICLAAVSQAAYVTWSATSVTKNSTALTAGRQYAFFYTTEAAATAAAGTFVNEMGLTAFNTAVASANFTDTKKATAAGTFSVGTTSSLGSYTKNGPLSNSALGLTGDTKYYAFLVVVDSETVSDKSNFIVTSVKYGTTKPDSTENAVSLFFGGQSSATWKSVGSVPEPTSGLLVMLGVGLMALRRRRA